MGTCACSHLVVCVGPGGGRHGDDGDREVEAHGEHQSHHKKQHDALIVATAQP